MEITRHHYFAVLIIAAIASGHRTHASLVTFVFGDSLTEVGNNNHLSLSLAKANYPYYGIDYDGGKVTGRFTNGRTIGDIIGNNVSLIFRPFLPLLMMSIFAAEKLGFPPPPPYLSLSPTDDAILKGVNYASGGAGILNETGLYFIERLTFDDQINLFKKTKDAIKNKVGEESANKLCNGALYFIGLGSNDYVNNYLQPFLADGQQYTHGEFLELIVSTLAEQITTLYQFGARKIVFHGLGPLGCIPSQRAKSKRGLCLEQVNQWVQQFNSKVKGLINNLNSHLPSSQITFADTYHDVLDLIENPTAYGFKDSVHSCCNVNTTVGGLCSSNAKVCNNRGDYVFWDAFHPSDAANELLAQRFFNTLFPRKAPSPAPAPSH